MATITTDTFLDSGTARTANETWSCNGAKLTIRTDTRWHAGAPASMTGSLGAVAITTLGGECLMDGRNVRWMPFDTGSGTVPAIGTTITQGGVTGYLLGAWASLTSAPTAVGAGMPATGFLKFREVSGGNYAAGALTGISCNATGPDVTGWIEVVYTQSQQHGGNALGNGYTARGSWFYLDNTNGAIGQLFQLPTNGGGATTTAFGMQVETSPGSNVFEWYQGMPIASGFSNTALTTDSRAKFVGCMSGGVMKIGTDGTNNVGFVPPSGCKVRIPNVIVRQCTSAAPATNAASSTLHNTRPRYSFTSSGGKIDLENVYSDFGYQIDSAVTVRIKDSMFESFFSMANISTSIYVENFANGCGVASDALPGLSTCTCPTTLINAKFMVRSGTQAFSITNCSNITGTDVWFICAPINKTIGYALQQATYMANCSFERLRVWGGMIGLAAGASNVSFKDVDYIEFMRAGFSTNANTYVISFGSGCSNITLDGLTFGNYGTLADCHPYGSMFDIQNGCGGGIVVKNIGTAAAPLSVGSNATYYPVRFLAATTTFGDLSNPIKFQRVFIANFRNNPINSAYFQGKNIIFEQCGLGPSKTFSWQYSDSQYKGMGCAPVISTLSLVQGSHWYDWLLTGNVGGVLLMMSNPSALSAPYVSYSLSATSGFSNSSSISLRTINDFVEYQMPYFAKGHTGLTSFTITGTNPANHTITYAIDTGSGFGSYKALSNGNLAAESISPTTGFKLKVKILCNTTNSGNAITCINIATATTDAAKNADLYPLSVATLGFTNLVAGSEVRVYAGSDPATATEIGGTESTGTTYSFTHSSGGTTGVIVIFAMGYQPFYLPYTFKSVDDSILVQQVIDRNYVNPA